jgi:glycerate dehydrogenase
MRTESPVRRARIVFLDRDTLPPSVQLRSPEFQHEWISFGRTEGTEVPSRLADADIVVTNKVPVQREAIEAATRLRFVAVAATGTDNVDLDACASSGIIVSNIRGYAIHTVPEHTFALILALRRNIIAYRNSNAIGRWSEAGQFCYFDHPLNDLAGSTLGVIGDGVIGRAVGDLGRAFGMTVLYSSYKGTTGMGPLYTPFEEVLRASDVITLHAPLLPSTVNMIGREEFALMQRRPIVINTARGGLVDESALCEALVQGTIRGAAFDVVTREPPPVDHPFLQLLGRPDFILTPHIAWASAEATQALADQLIENIEAFWAGKARNIVV